MTPSARRLPSLTALAAFEALLRRGSITLAARDLSVTPQAVSHHVKALEAQVGVDLIRYTNREWQLTPAGEAGEAALRSAFDGLRLAVRRMREATDRGRLTVSVDPALASTWLVRRLPGFHAGSPETEVLLDATTRIVDLDAGEADVAIRYGRGEYGGLRAQRLFDERVFPVCSPALAAGDPPLRRPADLAGHTLLHLDWQPAAGGWPDWPDWLRSAGETSVEATGGPRFTDHALALQAAMAGQGVALGSSPLTADALAEGFLMRPFGPVIDSGFGYDVVTRADEPSESVHRFVAWILGQTADR
ncbi:LysR substrate-binding domain-containing protein [Aquisalimonas lutea]|uniref:LysR substrate-binding domain-containing protein n=1 Tax=Aquisalimonas lutea TaxID=1327750 RepID=UPI0025B56EDB|nr:LysR substrate-binding domain-containing protein [Aquisalimonas lutea]MDN3519542.1 LysR substrate-binding domain-containing protein [Aquisalimonas lutea]